MDRFRILLLVFVLLLACDKQPATIAVTGVTLDKSFLELVEGDKATLVASVKPANASDQSVTWSCSDNSVAMVSSGQVTALKAGSATVTVTTVDGGKSATCKVTVKEKTYAVESVALDQTSLELTEGDNATLTATITPSNATNKNVKWSTSDKTVVTVTDGKVTAIKAGSATITVTTEDGSKTASCKVTVKAKTYPVTGVSLDKTTLSLTEGDIATLTATISPSNATNKNVKWSTSDKTVATVTDGKVTAIKAGTATVTVTTEDGSKTATCKVTVKAKTYPVTGVSLDKTTLSLTEGESSTLTATITPSNATNKNVKWSTSDKSVATVADGKVTAVKAGSATITVTTEDGSKTASCKVTVKAKEVPTITVSQTNYTVAGKGGTVALQITANIDYTITTTAGWITISGTTLTVAANTSTDARTAVVTIANSTYGKSVDVSIKQNGLNGLEDGDKIVTP